MQTDSLPEYGNELASLEAQIAAATAAGLTAKAAVLTAELNGRVAAIITDPTAPYDQTKDALITRRWSNGAVYRLTVAELRAVQSGSISVMDYGAVGDGVADDTVAINLAIAAANTAAVGAANGALLVFPKGIFKVTAALTTISKDRVRILGAGIYATKILFIPTAGATLFTIQNGAAEIFQNSIASLAIHSTDVTYTKVAVKAVDTSDFVMRDVLVTGFNETATHTSKGFQLQGRELTYLDNVTISADSPISIEVNPNNAIHCDHFHAVHTYLTADSKPVVTIATGVALTNFTMDGSAWVKGTYGLDWNDTTSAVGSYVLTLKNIRREQNQDATAYNVRVIHHTGLQDLFIEQFHGDPGQKGYYARLATRVTFQHVTVGNTGLNQEALNLDNCEFNAFNCYWEINTTVSLTTMQQKLAWNQKQSASPLPENVIYGPNTVATTPHTDQGIWLFGVKRWAYKGVLASGVTLAIPTSDDVGRTIAHVRVAGYAATGPIIEGGQVIDSAGATALAGGTANFVITNTAGKLCYIRQAASSTLIFNRTAQDLNIMIECSYW